MVIKNKIFFFLINFLFLISPFLQFFQTNSSEIDFYLYDLSKIFFIFIIIFTLIYLILHFLKKGYFILTLTFSFYILFQFNLISSYIPNLICIFILLFLIFLFHRYFSKIYLVNIFLGLYLLLNFIFFITEFFLSKNKNLDVYVEYKVEENFFEKKITNPQNIYLIIVDDMMSFDLFKEAYNFKEIDQYKKNLTKLNSVYNKGVYLKSGFTSKNIINILQLQEVSIDKNFNNYHSLIKYYFNNPSKSNLLNLLYKNEYKFNLIGNPYIDCYMFSKKICLEEPKKNIINFYVMDTFLMATPYKYLREIIKNFIKSNSSDLLSIRYKNLFYQIDAIGKFLKSFENKTIEKKQFFLIHHLSPHDPHLFNNDCSFRNTILNPDWELSKDYTAGYKSAYICTLSKIENLLKFINTNDENALVIMHGDLTDISWGPVPKYYKFILDKYNNVEVFSLVKSKTICKNKIPNNMSNIWILNYMIKCNFNLS